MFTHVNSYVKLPEGTYEDVLGNMRGNVSDINQQSYQQNNIGLIVPNAGINMNHGIVGSINTILMSPPVD